MDWAEPFRGFAPSIKPGKLKACGRSGGRPPAFDAEVCQGREVAERWRNALKNK